MFSIVFLMLGIVALFSATFLFYVLSRESKRNREPRSHRIFKLLFRLCILFWIAMAGIICLETTFEHFGSTGLTFTKENWKNASPNKRQGIYYGNQIQIDSTFKAMSIDQVIGMSGSPEYYMIQGRENIIGYNILDSNDSYRGYHRLEIAYDSFSRKVFWVETRDD